MADVVYDVSLEYKEIDTDTLHADLKAALGDKFAGFSSSPDGYTDSDGVTHSPSITLHFTERPTGKEVSTATLIWAQHDIDAIPPKPVIKSAEERIAELEAMVAALLTKVT